MGGLDDAEGLSLPTELFYDSKTGPLQQTRLLSYKTAISAKSKTPALPEISPPGRSCKPAARGGRWRPARPPPPAPPPASTLSGGPPKPPRSGPGGGEGGDTHQRMMERCRREVGLPSAIPGGRCRGRWYRPVGRRVASRGRRCPRRQFPISGRRLLQPGPRPPRGTRARPSASGCGGAGAAGTGSAGAESGLLLKVGK